MATWNSRGLRGSSLEELINYSNEKYRDKHSNQCNPNHTVSKSK